MKRKVAVITGTRAEYGLFRVILNKISNSDNLELKLIVTGSHLSPAHGNTYKQIEADGFKIDYKADILIASDTPVAIAKTMGLGILSFAQIFSDLKPDIVLILGDRYEMLAAASAALPFNIILAHIAGGEITEGIIDDAIRHSITKLSHIHFPCSNFYANNLLKLAEESWRIHNVGHPSIELIRQIDLISKEELCRIHDLDIKKKIFLVTFHPTTLNSIETERKESKIFFDVLKTFNNVNIVITSPNSDTNNQVILERIEFMKTQENVRFIVNLGSQQYFSFMKVCDLVLGNSSSGIGESTFFKVPVINYGDRQKGRLKAFNIIDVLPDEVNLYNSIDKALNDSYFIKSLEKVESIYGMGNTSEVIVKVLSEISIDEKLLRKKFN